jgi:hypothetical protein
MTSPINIDGHFWLEDSNGVIIEPTPFQDRKPFNISSKYYKKASPHIQKMVIEMTHRKYEEFYDFKRDSEEWEYILKKHTFIPNACFHNALKYMLHFNNNYKLVFGYLGVYHHTATQTYPKNSVYWLYGCSKYSTVREIFHTDKTTDIDNYWTYEKWDDRDNKLAVIGLVKK